MGRGQCDPSLFDYWYFLVEGNCTYVGTKEFEGVKVDVWDCVDGVSGLHNYRRYYYGCSRGAGGGGVGGGVEGFTF